MSSIKFSLQISDTAKASAKKSKLALPPARRFAVLTYAFSPVQSPEYPPGLPSSLEQPVSIISPQESGQTYGNPEAEFVQNGNIMRSELRRPPRLEEWLKGQSDPVWNWSKTQRAPRAATLVEKLHVLS
jgi:hypothetical protein